VPRQAKHLPCELVFVTRHVFNCILASDTNRVHFFFSGSRAA